MSFIKGMGDFQREFSQSDVFKALDREIAKLSFNPHDAKSIAAALVEMRAAIDAKIAPYRGNPLVESIVPKLKEHYRNAILRRAEAASGSSGGASARASTSNAAEVRGSAP